MDLATQFQKLAALEEFGIFGERRVHCGFFGSEATEVLNLREELVIEFDVGSHGSVSAANNAQNYSAVMGGRYYC